MFTDMAGYSALMQQDEAAAVRSRDRHRQALQHGLDAHEGQLLQYFGDGSLSIFTSSLQAVQAAIEIQRHVEGDPGLRIGLHVGDIAYDAQGAYGDAINIAARLEAICRPGGVTISSKVYDDIRRHPDLAVVPIGSVRLKNIDDPVPTYALAVEGLARPEPPEGEVGPPAEMPGGLPPALMKRIEDLDRYTSLPLSGVSSATARVPLVGRRRELDEIRHAIEMAEAHRASTIFLRGPRGVGKTRMTQEVVRFARDRGWIVLRGRAHPSERLVPYAPFADAFVPLLQGLDRNTLARLTPGSDAALCALFPALGPAPRSPDMGPAAPGESRTRLYWQFTGLLSLLSEHKPLLLALEDLDFADQASLELLEFVTRQSGRLPVVVIGEYTGADRARKHALLSLEQSLVSAGTGRVFTLEAFSQGEAEEFIRLAFDLDDESVRRLAEVVYLWSRGNPFFMTGTLRGMVETGALRHEDGEWRTGDLEHVVLPHSVRDAVLVWLGLLGPKAIELARRLAVVGREAPYEVIRHISGFDDSDLGPALDELVRHQLVQETESRWTLAYSFRNPLIRETLRSEMGLAQRRELHTSTAQALEAFYGTAADEHADELAYHFARAYPHSVGSKTVRYLTLAGEGALRRQANQEAAESLQEAIDRIEASAPGAEERSFLEAALLGLGRARRRLGDSHGSLATWRRLLAAAQAKGDTLDAARWRRQVGLTLMGAGRLEEAAEELATATELASGVGRIPLVVQSQLAEAACLGNLGRAEEADRAVQNSLVLARELGNPRVLGQVHRTRVQLYIWSGRIDEAREAAETALEICAGTGDRGVEFWSRWALGALEGLIGNTAAMAAHIELAQAIADEIASPFLDLATRELAVELAYARGEWELGIRMGKRAIEFARSTHQRLVLPRLLVWVSLMHIGRDELDEADRLTREAWEVSGADRTDRGAGFIGLHAVVPAHIGRASYHMARGEWAEASAMAEAGLRLADSSGYIVWAIHHILPIIGEAAIHARDLPRAEAAGRRMRAEAERIGHPLGLAWAEACDAVLTWLRNDAHAGVVSLEAGARALEAIPLTYEAARLRRQLAGRLAEVGDRDRALAELTRAWRVLESLGAQRELQGARDQFREMDAEPPTPS
jgi:tetratricopeptide (TPR) repeat protein